MNPRRRRSNKHRRADRALALRSGYSVHEWATGAAHGWLRWLRKYGTAPFPWRSTEIGFP